MNHFEEIKTYNIDEMVDFFYETFMSCQWCALNDKCDRQLDTCKCKSGYKKWLESEVER